MFATTQASKINGSHMGTNMGPIWAAMWPTHVILQSGTIWAHIGYPYGPHFSLSASIWAEYWSYMGPT